MDHKYFVHELIYKANKHYSAGGDSSLQDLDYRDILDKLQRIIAKNHSAELAQVLSYIPRRWSQS